MNCGPSPALPGLAPAATTGIHGAMDGSPITSTSAGAELAACIARHATATQALQHWCETRLQGPPASIEARLLISGVAPPSAAPALAAGTHETLRHRRVQLTWNGIILSDADNWYLPARLPPLMRAAVHSGGVPFGALIRPLLPRRIALPTEPSNGAKGYVLHLRALVVTDRHGAVAEVSEHYHAALLG
jgi:hypothetical protein